MATTQCRGKSLQKSDLCPYSQTFLSYLKKRYTQFANVTILTIFTHLLTEYGQLSDQAVQDNDTLMKKDINAETDFEDLVLQI